MGRIDRALAEFRLMEEEARGEGRMQALNPLSKLLVTVVYLIVLLSFHKYALTGILLMGFYPALAFTFGEVPLCPMWRRMRVILIPVLLVGIANPFFDRTPVSAGYPFITGGMISMLSLLLKGLFAVAAAYLMMVTTPMDDLCRTLRKLRVPAVLVTVIMLIYRYFSVFLEEIGRMWAAYSLRAPGQKGVHFRVWGPMVGMLLLRSIDRSSTLYESMTMRGFRGDFLSGRDRKFSFRDIVYITICILAVLIIRSV